MDEEEGVEVWQQAEEGEGKGLPEVHAQKC